jgi:hypothetical protein
MKGVIVDCKTGKVREIDDGFPMPEYTTPEPELKSLDLAEVAQKLKEFDQLKAEFSELKKAMSK